MPLVAKISAWALSTACGRGQGACSLRGVWGRADLKKKAVVTSKRKQACFRPPLQSALADSWNLDSKCHHFTAWFSFWGLTPSPNPCARASPLTMVLLSWLFWSGLVLGIVAKYENILPFFYGMMFPDFAKTLPHKGEDCQFRKAFRNLLLSLCTPSPSLRWHAMPRWFSVCHHFTRTSRKPRRPKKACWRANRLAELDSIKFSWGISPPSCRAKRNIQFKCEAR